MKRTLSARISADLDREMRATCQARNISISTVIERSLDDYLREIYRRPEGYEDDEASRDKGGK